MARYTDPVCRLCRREGMKLFLKGDRCFSPKCAFERRSYPPGMHAKKTQFKRTESDYALQLREKQKVKRIYGVMERQFRRYFRHALRTKGMTGVTLLQMLESRLDNVVYRLGFASSRAQARQLVRHGHFTVNGRKTNIPSYLVKVDDVIAVRPESRSRTYFRNLGEFVSERTAPSWLSLDADGMSARVVGKPSREDIDLEINEQLVVEFYSR
ncbi:MAG: 30S ribosomal protein S4 [Caldilineales bacterium]|nr:30S ribosomal protein S4 [Caldilineales bacterium]MDW8316257.1 30S ribosomal protein S4 [Anaerolineae bacterium]